MAASKDVKELEPDYAITDGDLETCCDSQGVNVDPGGAALVRTGNHMAWDVPGCVIPSSAASCRDT